MKFKFKRKERVKESNPLLIKLIIGLMSITLFVYCFSLLMPLFWMIFTSLKDEISYTIDNLGFPTSFHFSNYSDVLTKYLYVDIGNLRYGVDTMFINSITLAVGSTFMSVFFTVLCAYALSRFSFVGNKLIYTIGIVTMVLPIVGSLPATFMVKRALHIYDNMFLHILTSGGGFSGMNFLILYAAFKAIPKDFNEAAEIDGAGDYLILFRIMIPMIIPTATTLFVLGFIGAWNDYSTPLVWLPSYPNLPFGMYAFQQGATGGGDGAGMTIIMAGFVIVMIPTVIIYALAQKIMNSNFVVGGIKG